MVRNMVKVLTIIVMEINILENGSKTKRMEMEFFNILQEQFTMVNGLMIKLQIKEKSFIQTKINMKEIS